MPYQFGAVDQSPTQMAISEALDHALEYGDDITAFELAHILRGMTSHQAAPQRSAVKD